MGNGTYDQRREVALGQNMILYVSINGTSDPDAGRRAIPMSFLPHIDIQVAENDPPPPPSSTSTRSISSRIP